MGRVQDSCTFHAGSSLPIRNDRSRTVIVSLGNWPGIRVRSSRRDVVSRGIRQQGHSWEIQWMDRATGPCERLPATVETTNGSWNRNGNGVYCERDKPPSLSILPILVSLHNRAYFSRVSFSTPCVRVIACPGWIHPRLRPRAVERLAGIAGGRDIPWQQFIYDRYYILSSDYTRVRRLCCSWTILIS